MDEVLVPPRVELEEKAEELTPRAVLEREEELLLLRTEEVPPCAEPESDEEPLLCAV